MKKSIIITIAFVLAMMTSFYFGRYGIKNPPISPIEVKVDTLYLHDTITAEKPVFFEKKVIQEVRVPVTEYETIHDTMYVFLEREQIRWADEYAEVYTSGIQPSVDSVKHFLKERVVTIETTIPVETGKKTRWGFGIQAGYGATLIQGRAQFTPYVGVGVSYNLIAW